jgi:hypothetical protein
MANKTRYDIERRSKLKAAYGITPEQFDAMVTAQGGVCVLCGNPPAGKRHTQVLHIDHDHRTGRVRGLLCDTCNVGLGSFRDNPDLLKRAAAYLEFHLG